MSAQAKSRSNLLSQANNPRYNTCRPSTDNEVTPSTLTALSPTSKMKRKLDSVNRDISPPPNIKRPPPSTQKSAALTSFFTPLTQKKSSTTKVEWQIRRETLIMGKYRAKDIKPHPSKIAAFDLDGTLIRVKSGARFSSDAGDWTWLYSKIPTKLKTLHAEGYEIVIFSNQSRISFEPKAKTFPQWKQKLQAMAETLDIPFMVFAATSKEDWFRKPRVGMWDTYAKEIGISLKDGLTMFFVGDAAGRMTEHATSRPKDFADTDRKFAMNLKIPFYTPEEYFLGDKPANFIFGAFNPQDYIPTPISSQNGTSAIATKLQIPVITPSTEPDVILFVGSPASGKSTFYRDHLHPMGYTRINQDTLKTRDRCVAEASTLLAESTPIVIDNTNADRNTRKIWIDLANQFDCNIRCIHFTASSQLARHNNLVRALGGTAKEDRKLLPMAAIYSFVQRYQEPALEEGFTEIIKVNFIFTGTEEEKEIWSMWWD